MTEFEEKEAFVRKKLAPMLRAAKIHVSKAKYIHDEMSGAEVVEITYESGFRRYICVTADSLKAVIQDVMGYV